ncbi:activator-dependent family glycosyltransferase [Streptomyces chromofuscus]|uniref:Activator-dependent family glycosyltransferase n=1 Tax=Streptomyces chromofuscus TaxID=42881 RepID=A0A7M2T7T6_STRCW|nr:activator-dependent family glycosyltransferase [Streptomyces chromofuscus]QOV43748.1 activator-dependent family glycosyltransferase [Streptomyces chromofuscus]GGT35566.1 glycosyl transferase [Streptomyces chromofuscus]
MRVLFTIFPTSAHLYPAIPLAWALQSAGHEVVVASPEGVVDPKVIANITSAGLTAVSLGGKEELTASLGPLISAAGPDRPTLALDPDDENAWRTARAVLAGMFQAYYPPPPAEGGRRPILDALVEFAEAWRPDLVLWDPLAPTGAVAARVCGAAHARLLFGMDNIGLIRARTRQERADPASGPAEDPWMPWLGPVLERYGLDFTEETLVGQWTLDLTQSRMRHPLDLTYVPVRRIPYNGAATLPQWLHARPERPRAVLTLGVSRRLLAGRHSGFPMREFFDSVSGLDLELVATLNSEQLSAVGTLPDNVRAMDYVPLTQVLPTSSAIIHHGGGGTFATAVAFKVPQFVVPLPMWDEMVTARYVVSRGAGLAADPAAIDVDSLHKDLVRLLEDPSFQLGARGLYEDMLAAPAPKDVIPVLERLTAEHRG